MTGPQLPAPYDTAQASAGLEYRRRHITLTLTGPGQLHRCAYELAWLTISEREPWAGEPLWLSATRRAPGDTWSRILFTDRARTALAAQLVPVIARHGFGTWWAQLHQARPVDHTRQADTAAGIATWWTDRQDLTDWYAAGHVHLTPITGDDRPRVLTVDPGHRSITSAEIAARAWRDGEHVGWLTTDGALIPLDHPIRIP